MKKKNIIIIGSGISGLLSNHILKKKYNTFIIERSSDAGGLLGSIKYKKMFFDYGTHVPFKINHKEIDNILFGKLKKKKWNIFKRSVKEGIFNFGKLDKTSGTLDVRLLNKKILKKAQKEFLKIKPKKKFTNLLQRINYEFGTTIKKYIFEPAIKKISNKNLKDLTPDFLENFSIERVRLFDGEKTIKLKKIPSYNMKLSYNKISDRNSPYEKYYFKKGGSINWLKQFINKKDIFLNSSIKNIRIKNKKILDVRLSNNKILKCEKLIWTGPPVSFLHLANKKIKTSKPNFRNLIIVHFEIDKKISHNLQYVTNYDCNFKTYRVTFYSNLRNNFKKKPYNLSCEIITDNENKDLNDLKNNTFTELVSMKVIPKNSKILNSFITFKKSTVIVHSPKSYRSFKSQVSECKKVANNIILLGRNNFKHALYLNLLDTYNQSVNL